MHKNFKDLGFKVGDKVRCTESIDELCYKVGDVFTLGLKNQRVEPYIIKDNGDFFSGISGEWELVEDEVVYKTFAALGFKVGDTIKCVDDGGTFKVGKVAELVKSPVTYLPAIKQGCHYSGTSGKWELVEDKKDESMFVETVTTNSIKDFSGCKTELLSAYVSLQKYNDREVRLAVGTDTIGDFFNKTSLQKLVNELQKVVDVMGESW